jgi:hypothetical protein
MMASKMAMKPQLIVAENALLAEMVWNVDQILIVRAAHA